MLDLKTMLVELGKAATMPQLEVFFQTYLGKKGLFAEQAKQLKDMSPEEKKSYGLELNKAREQITEAYESKLATINRASIDTILQEDLVESSLSKAPSDQGTYSLLANIRREAEEICKSMGFVTEYGTDVVSKFENFEAVNIPLTHPATEMHDTIYLDDKDPKGESLILRTHTSSMQNYLIQKYGLSLKAVVPGRVYRYENMDAHHDVMFYQLEGIVIDKHLSIAHFKDMMEKLLSALLHKKVETRMRPGYFPFVEPGFEIDVRYEIYNQETGQKELSNRMELIGAGMVHPNVLKLAGVNTEEGWSGFAFGMGINRLAAVRYGIKDIRYFTNGDLRFAKSFA